MMKQKKSCSNCIKGYPVSVNNDIFCREKGIVSSDFVCGKHRFQSESKSFKVLNFKCIHCENFIINPEASFPSETTGLCRLFSVRQFNGKERNACSKFVKKSDAVLL
ncbi:MAG: hypothetical protein ACOX7R_12695 [Acetivibrionales bacterium]|jgi:hypothetical protein